MFNLMEIISSTRTSGFCEMEIEVCTGHAQHEIEKLVFEMCLNSTMDVSTSYV